MNPADFVLCDFSKIELKELGVELEVAADAVESLLSRGLADTQNVLHVSG